MSNQTTLVDPMLARLIQRWQNDRSSHGLRLDGNGEAFVGFYFTLTGGDLARTSLKQLVECEPSKFDFRDMVLHYRNRARVWVERPREGESYVNVYYAGDIVGPSTMSAQVAHHALDALVFALVKQTSATADYEFGGSPLPFRMSALGGR